MTREEILAMPKGLNLDAIVEEKVMGFRVLRDGDGLAAVPVTDKGPFPPTRFLPPIPHYSGDGRAVLRVLNRMKELGWLPWLEVEHSYGGAEDYWECGMGHVAHDAEAVHVKDIDEVPAAWCKAAILALEEKPMG